MSHFVLYFMCYLETLLKAKGLTLILGIDVCERVVCAFAAQRERKKSELHCVRRSVRACARECSTGSLLLSIVSPLSAGAATTPPGPSLVVWYFSGGELYFQCCTSVLARHYCLGKLAPAKWTKVISHRSVDTLEKRRVSLYREQHFEGGKLPSWKRTTGIWRTVSTPPKTRTGSSDSGSAF